MAQNADIQISASKMVADSRYADIEKKCRYADADINIGTSLLCMSTGGLKNNTQGDIILFKSLSVLSYKITALCDSNS